MKLAIVGSRTFNDYPFLVQEVLKINDIEKIISGGARGADSLAIYYAQQNNIQFRVFLANWGQFGKKAGFIRNVEIVDYSDVILAFWDGQSKGTQHTIKLAGACKKPVFIRWPEIAK